MPGFFDYIRRFPAAASLTAANIAVFLLLRIVAVIDNLALTSWLDPTIDLVAFSSDPADLLLRPWTLLTFMFAQFDIVHLLVNLMWLWLAGQFLRMVPAIGLSRRPSLIIVAIYILGGIAGAVAFMAFAPAGSILIGSSASVMSLIGTAALTGWRTRLPLMFFGPVRFIWVAAAAVFFMTVGATSAAMLAAHLGGLLLGLLAAPMLMYIAKSSKSSTSNSSPQTSNSLNSLLDKVSRSGYASLTADERALLIEISRKLSSSKPSVNPSER